MAKPFCDSFLGKLSIGCAVQKIQAKKGNVPSFAQQPQTGANSPTVADPGMFGKNTTLLLIGGVAAIGILFYVLRKK